MPKLDSTADGGKDTTKSKAWGLFNANESDFNLNVHEEPYLKTPTD